MIKGQWIACRAGLILAGGCATFSSIHYGCHLWFFTAAVEGWGEKEISTEGVSNAQNKREGLLSPPSTLNQTWPARWWPACDVKFPW